jgi:hypothetical protein
VVINDDTRTREGVLESINDERFIEVDTQDMAEQSAASEKNLAVLPITNSENNVSFAYFCQRAILL